MKASQQRHRARILETIGAGLIRSVSGEPFDPASPAGHVREFVDDELRKNWSGPPGSRPAPLGRRDAPTDAERAEFYARLREHLIRHLGVRDGKPSDFACPDCLRADREIRAVIDRWAPARIR